MAGLVVNDEDDDDVPVLSGDTLALLQSFYTARDDDLSRFADMKPGGATTHIAHPLSMAMFAEDWNASQFWYDDATARSLATHLLHSTPPGGSIAVVSCPSVFVQLLNLTHDVEDAPRIRLLEYDDRFDVFEGFVRYDFEKAAPLQLPLGLKGAFDTILSDPPYHSEDCQRKFATTVHWLGKPGSTPTRIMVCTGESMAGVVSEIYAGVKTTTFDIVHEQGRLKSEYVCYANF